MKKMLKELSMKRICFVITIILALQCAMHAQSSESSAVIQSPGLITVAKELNGTITSSTLSLTLRSIRDCDRTQIEIPDESRLVSDSFALNADENGIGTFYGTAIIITPDGQALHVGTMRGTVGINKGCDQNKPCIAPWHLEGIFEPVPTFAPNPNGQITMANFSADLNQQAAGPRPVYRGRLDGWFAPPPAFAQRVKIAPDKTSYLSRDIIVAIITNSSEMIIQSFDLKSFCTIVELQREEHGRWVNTGQCLLARTPLPVNINPGETMKVELQPIGIVPGANEPGVYRLALTFRAVEDDKPVSDYLVAVSPLFRINAMPRRDGVNVFADRKNYFIGQNINVTIDNNSDQDILTSRGRTDCTFVYLQRLDGSNWINVAECTSVIPAVMIKIASRQRVTIKLPDDPLTSTFGPGTYRLEFSYFPVESSGQTTGRENKVYSAQFQILPRQ
jgi:hypothetical protein